MAGHVVQESGLTFEFPAGWGVRKYDGHTFYKGLSSVGLKAVDFIVLPPDGALWLIEVKNFLPRQTAGRTYYPKIKATKRLAEQVHYKFRDSLRAIDIIHRYYQRKWLFRLLKGSLRFLGRFGSDWTFWAEAHARLQARQAPHLLIWLELDEERKTYRTRFFATLLKHFQGEAVQLEMGFSGRNPLPGMAVSGADDSG